MAVDSRSWASTSSCSNPPPLRRCLWMGGRCLVHCRLSS